jgi:hypothetical protein
MLWESFSSMKAKLKLSHKGRAQSLVLSFALLVVFVACASPVPTATLMPTTISQPTRTPVVGATLAPTDEPSATPAPTQTETPLATSSSTSGQAGNADVLFVRAVQTDDGTWTFSVTVAHLDTGWEDYADGWDVLTPDGEVLKPDPSSPFTRLLLHPHENEQPFTRSQSGIVIPDGVMQVRVRAHDLIDGYGGREVVVDLTVSSGSDFEVER